jgi:hypothetical protein
MPDAKSRNEDGQENTRGGQAQEPQCGERIVDGRLDPDAQSPDHKRTKPFDLEENDPA